MTGRTHLLAGLIAGIAMSQVTGDNHIVIIGACLLGSLAPDIDHPQSMINGIIPFVRWTHLITGHRGLLHGLFIPIYLLSILMFPQPIAWIMDVVSLLVEAETTAPSWSYVFLPALGLGWLSHILLDAMTPRGVPLFYPIRTPINLLPKFLSPTTGGFFEFIFSSCLAVIIFLQVSYIFIN